MVRLVRTSLTESPSVLRCHPDISTRGNLTILVVVVCAHLVDGVDRVADGPVELGPLVVAQAIGREGLQAGDEV